MPPTPEEGPAPLGGADPKSEDVWTVGVDCCGLMVDWEAVQALLGRKARLVWASDSDPVVKKYVLEKYKMDVWYDNAFRLTSGPAVPRCRIYTAGFPCQPCSSAGQGFGLDDPRGNIFFGCRDYIDTQRPDIFILENFVRLERLEGGRVIAMFMYLLRFIGGGAYVVSKFLLNSEDFAVPHHRLRVYIIGRRRELIKEENMRIRLLGREDIGAFLDPLSVQQPPETKQLTPLGRRNLNAVLKALKAKGAEPRDEDWIVDVDVSEFPGSPQKCQPMHVGFAQ